MSDLIFAFFHILLILAVIIYAFVSLFQGNSTRFLLIAACLIGYYLLVLHKPLKKEIKRLQEKRKN